MCLRSSAHWWNVLLRRGKEGAETVVRDGLGLGGSGNGLRDGGARCGGRSPSFRPCQTPDLAFSAKLRERKHHSRSWELGTSWRAAAVVAVPWRCRGGGGESQVTFPPRLRGGSGGRRGGAGVAPGRSAGSSASPRPAGVRRRGALPPARAGRRPDGPGSRHVRFDLPPFRARAFFLHNSVLITGSSSPFLRGAPNQEGSVWVRLPGHLLSSLSALATDASPERTAGAAALPRGERAPRPGARPRGTSGPPRRPRGGRARWTTPGLARGARPS